MKVRPYDIDLRIYNILSDPNYYSLGLRYLAQKIDVPIDYLLSLDGTKNTKFQDRFHDFINIFTFNSAVYIGLESRRIAYEEDKKNKRNWVEDAIKAGGTIQIINS